MPLRLKIFLAPYLVSERPEKAGEVQADENSDGPVVVVSLLGDLRREKKLETSTREDTKVSYYLHQNKCRVND